MEQRRFAIAGQDPQGSIEFVACPDISGHTYDVKISFAGYSVYVSSVSVWIGSFLGELANFELTRKGQASLAGTYDFFMEMAPYQSRGDALVSFGLTHPLILPTGKYGRCRLEGAFVVYAEYVSGILHGMRRLFAHD